LTVLQRTCDGAGVVEVALNHNLAGKLVRANDGQIALTRRAG